MSSSGAPGLDADVLIIGGGIIGLSTAMHLTERQPGLRVLVVEKEDQLAAHQTGRNSGVIHAGVYYAPGSLKARFCREGAAATYAFSAQHGIPAEQCGKLIVATNELEVSRLQALFARCRENGLDPQLLDAAALNRLEPAIVGHAAVLVRTSGIADYPAICQVMARLLRERGGDILLGEEVTAIREEARQVTVEAGGRVLRASHLIVCGGLMADRLARLCGLDVRFRIVPFRGEYFRLPESRNHIVQHLVYPTPDPSLPFLGVHLTRMIGGYVTVGPNAILALAREGYRWRDVNARDLMEMARFGGFWKLMSHHASSGLMELKNSLFKRAYLQACRKYCPDLTLEDLQPYRSGVRAQAVAADGTLIHDFLIERGTRSLHVCNAPSPAATAALPIGAYLAEQFRTAFS